MRPAGFRSPASALWGALLCLAACNRADPVLDGGSPGSPDGGGVDPACAKSNAKAELKRVNLVFMLDRSGSMGDGMNGDPTTKWDPVTAGLKAFFADANSLGVSASLQYFPYTNMTDQCNSSAYYNASVPMRSLPDATTFATSIDAIKPAGGTPTLPAIVGAIDYATDTQKADPSARAAIVLVTDGEPDDCMSSVKGVSTEVEKIAATIPTYVVGVGDALSSLSMIAMSGGTGAPTLVSTTSPAQTTSDFLSALDQIRGLVLTCSFVIPRPVDGMDIDFNNVNVVFTPGSGTASTLKYSKDCATDTGWHYDDPQKPTKVELCPSSCDAARNDRAGAIDIVFGCATYGGVIL
jgi:hypothetical protein